MAYVYRHIRLDTNEVFYVGIGTDDRYKRANEKARRNSWWKKIVAKSEYRVEIFFDEVENDFAKEKEVEFIAIYGGRDLGLGSLVNMTNGGDGLANRVFTTEYREKLSKAAKARVLSEEQKDKLRKMQIGRKHSNETKRKMSVTKSLNPYVATESLKKFRSERMKVNNPAKGKFRSQSQNYKGVIEVYKEGAMIGFYEGVYETCRQLGLSATKISACLGGRRKTHGGYSFKRIDTSSVA